MIHLGKLHLQPETERLFTDFNDFNPDEPGGPLHSLFNWREFSLDIWQALIDSHSDERQMVDAGYSWAELVLSEVRRLPEWKGLSMRCQGDPWPVHIAAPILSRCIAMELPVLNNPNEPIDFLSRVRDEAQGMVDLGLPGDVNAAIATVKSKAEGFRDDIKANRLNDIRSAVRSRIARIHDLLDKLEAAEGTIGGGWGRGKTGMPTAGDIKKRKALADRVLNNPKIMRIVELAGRKVRVAEREQSRKATSQPTEIVGIEYGDDLQRACASELAMYSAGGELQDLFLKNYADESVQQYRMAGNMPAAKGPIVFLGDVSGSMRGMREEWMKASAIALSVVAKRQKRDLVIMEFDTDTRHVATFKNGEVDIEATLDWLTKNCSGGGTSFESPLAAGIDAMKELKHADLIMVTDGEAHVSPIFGEEFKISKSDLGFSLRTFTIGGGGSCIADLSDSVEEIDALDSLSDTDKSLFSI